MPPRGPGVVAPFPAAPRERNPRLWIGLGVAVLVVLLCVGGGVVGLVSYTVHTSDQAQQTVRRFLTAIVDQSYQSAYQMQCAGARSAQSEQDFANQFTGDRRLVAFQLSTPTSSNEAPGSLVVPSTLRYATGAIDKENFVVRSAGQGSSAVQVCGVTG